MIDIKSIADLELLRETVDLECKLALGRDGKGAIPQDFWPTYSSFANTQGGVVILGVRERQQQFELEGITNVAKIRTELFDCLNNRNKVSANLLTDADVKEVTLNGKHLLLIQVPRASRKHRPVYCGANPLGGHTYRRLNDGDRCVPDDEVKRMFAEQVEDSRDDRILHGYNFDDLSRQTFRAYRQVFANREPDHPWNTLEDLEFLRQIGGWRKDRETGESGLTLAGLLMFGWMATIQEELPNYMLDYQERPEARTELRWIDRVTLDGKWSGNLYDFYRKVYRKLTADLKVPFALDQGERKDETVVHVALREALANVLVHADYSDRASVLVVKRPDMFGFRNPGLMRIPADVAIRGGEHDCRNRTLHKMFRLVGVGEQAGSGIPKIYAGWAQQHWRPPKLHDQIEPFNQTLLQLPLADLLPPDLVEDLRREFGDRFDALNQNERLTLAAAAAERVVTHSRVREMTGLHPFDTTRLLQGLVQRHFMESHNPGRGAVYCLPGAAIPMPDDVFGIGGETAGRLPADLSNSGSSSPNLNVSSPNLTARSPNLTSRSPNLTASSPNLPEVRNRDGCLVSPQLRHPVIDDLQALSSQLRDHLEKIASVPRHQGKVDREVLIDVIERICDGRFVTLRCLAELVNRKPATLRDQYLTKLVRERRLALAFPTVPTHEKQAYTTAASLTKLSDESIRAVGDESP